jgi:hypothetical protein
VLTQKPTWWMSTESIDLLLLESARGCPSQEPDPNALPPL